jgi:hypothetical protein
MTDTKNDEKFDEKILDKLENFDLVFKVAKLCGVSCKILDVKANISENNLSFEENKCLGF